MVTNQSVDRSLEGRTVLVTGGARRVGAAISRHLGSLGARVIVHYHTSASQARRLLDEELRGHGRILSADLATPQGAADLVGTCFEAEETLDSIVHSAASFLRRPALETTADEWDAVFDLNLRSLFLLAQAFARRRAGKGGVLIAVSDVAGLDIWPNYLAHSVAKAGTLALVRGLAKALAPDFRVNAIVPGPVLPPESASEEEVERIRKRTLLRRIGEPEDVAHAAAFLLTSSYTTGSVIEVTGGAHLSVR